MNLAGTEADRNDERDCAFRNAGAQRRLEGLQELVAASEDGIIDGTHRSTRKFVDEDRTDCGHVGELGLLGEQYPQGGDRVRIDEKRAAGGAIALCRPTWRLQAVRKSG